MTSRSSADACGADSAAVGAVADLFHLAADDIDSAGYLEQALRGILRATGGRYTALAAAVAGRWTPLAEAGAAQPLPADLLAEVLDQDRPLEHRPWCAVPLRAGTDRSEALVVHSAGSLALLEALASAFATGFDQVRDRDRLRQRVRRLETIIEIAQQWYQTNKMTPLLVQVAEAATRLLHADRASIFLWDRPNRTLVGRPALGVEGGELRIADDTGIVGQVVHTARPRRVGQGDPGVAIDRVLAAQLSYEVKTLLCVPLLSNSGRVLGAFEVLNKKRGDFSDDDQAALVELASHAAIALEKTKQLEDLLTTHRQLVDEAAAGIQLVGRSPAVEALRSTVQRVADTDLAVLILGENGTGKEVVSRSIHYQSRRRDQPFVAVNCAALAESLLESELFGHEKGAFTDAHEARPGKFELAAGGTLFLDEIGEMSLSGQAKLLRVLEEKVVVRVRGSTPIHTDVRVLAATNQNLAAAVGRKEFREDIYYRLNVVTLELPPLRDRGDDVLLLAEHFLQQFCRQAGRKVPPFSAAAKKRLLGHAWPGNVRELRNLMERVAYMLPGDRIEPKDLAFILSPGEKQAATIDPDLPLADATRRFQSEHIHAAIERARGSMSTAAERLGLHRSNLYRKMRQLNMPTDEADNDP